MNTKTKLGVFNYTATTLLYQPPPLAAISHLLVFSSRQLTPLTSLSFDLKLDWFIIINIKAIT